jgi:uncharacterized protein YkwD
MTTPRHVLITLAVLISAGVLVGQASAATIPPRKALLKAINHARAVHSVGVVRGSSSLRAIALAHSEDMLRRDYFAHASPTGSTLTSRIQQSGFVSGYSWTAGETLAWGWGTQAAAKTTVKAWLHSPEHRAILLSGAWVSVGVAVLHAPHAPGVYEGEATTAVTADFGRPG